MEIRDDIGYRRGRKVPTGFDAIWYSDLGWTSPRRIGLAERRPGASLILLAHLSESEVEEACNLLASRECDGKTERTVVHPQPLEEDD